MPINSAPASNPLGAVVVSGTPLATNVLTATSATAADWEAVSGSHVNSGVAGGKQPLVADGAGGAAFQRNGVIQLADSTAGAGGVASFDFSAIDQNYIALLIQATLRSDQPTQQTCNLRFNNDSAAVYDIETAGGTGGVATNAESLSQTAGTVIIMPTSGDTAGNVAVATIEIPNYTGTAFHKCAFVSGGVHTSTYQVRTIFNTWRNTAAIVRVTLLPSAGSFLQGSRATLWGVI